MNNHSHHRIDQSDIEAVIEVLTSTWLTTGPKIREFEDAIAYYNKVSYGVAVSNGTSALHCAAYAVGIQPGDEVIIPAIAFAATANCIIPLGGKPVIVDVEPDTLLIDPKAVEAHITVKTKAIIAVDYAGHPCDYRTLKTLAEKYSLFLISDACHALGARYEDKTIAQLADITVFSFHPVKHITNGEGGAVVTDDLFLKNRVQQFRNHGIDADLNPRRTIDTWYYEVVDLGFNYRITDFQCALGLGQLKNIETWIRRREKIARQYDDAFYDIDALEVLKVKKNMRNTYHLYVVQLKGENNILNRAELFLSLRERGIDVNVHYIPLNLHPFYQNHLGAQKGQCPVAEKGYQRIISLPIFPAMSDENVDYVIQSVIETISEKV